MFEGVIFKIRERDIVGFLSNAIMSSSIYQLIYSPLYIWVCNFADKRCCCIPVNAIISLSIYEVQNLNKVFENIGFL